MHCYYSLKSKIYNFSLKSKTPMLAEIVLNRKNIIE